MLSDHLGSSSITTTAGGTWNSEIRYSAFGETRYSSGITPTDYRYTGQLEQADVNLYYYNARYYDAALGRFIQSDISIPEVKRTTAYDRYAFVENNPILFVDLNGLEKVIIFLECSQVIILIHLKSLLSYKRQRLWKKGMMRKIYSISTYGYRCRFFSSN